MAAFFAPGDLMPYTPSPLFTVLWDIAQAEEQLSLLLNRYEQLRPQLPGSLDTQTALISDGLHAVRNRLAAAKHNAAALFRQEK